MANELIKSSAMPQTLTESINMGEVFFKSGLFTDLKSAAQAVVKIQAGSELGIPPFAALTGIHIIAGKPVLGAGLIASRIKGSGKYNYRVTEQSDKMCSIDFYEGKEKIGNSTFTLEDARKAGTKNLDKFARNMLFARAISNGVKWFCPDVFAGPVYTPEDFDQQEQRTEDVQHEEIKVEVVNEVAAGDKALLFQLLNSSNMEPGTEEYKAAWQAIDNCRTYKGKTGYEAIQHKLEARQKPFDQIVNPSQKDINNHLKDVQAA